MSAKPERAAGGGRGGALRDVAPPTPPAAGSRHPDSSAHAHPGARKWLRHVILWGGRSSAMMAAYLQWRRFVFFDKELVKEPLGSDGAAPGAAPTSGPAASKPLCLPPGITVCDSGRGTLVFGDILPLRLCLASRGPYRDQRGWALSVRGGSCCPLSDPGPVT